MVTPVQDSLFWRRPRAERAAWAIFEGCRRPQSPNTLRPQGYKGVDYPTFLRDLIRRFSPIGGEGQPGGVGVRVRIGSDRRCSDSLSSSKCTLEKSGHEKDNAIKSTAVICRFDRNP